MTDDITSDTPSKRKLSDRRPDEFTPTDRPTRWLFRYFYKWLGGVTIIGSENVPKVGPVILAPNHVSMADPPLMACVLDRPMRFFTKAELFKVFFIGPYIRGLGAFPVVRGTPDRKAIRQAIDVLTNGEMLLMFPEGVRGDGVTLGEPEKGITMIATKTSAMIVPVFIAGTEKMLPRGGAKLRRNHLTVRFGKPIDVAPYKDRRSAGDTLGRDIMAAIGALRDEHLDSKVGASAAG